MSELLEDATEAAENAHCPYSNFHVGAAVLASKPDTPMPITFTGANIENASYGLTICAERVAIFKAVTSGFTKLHKVAVVCADGTSDSSQDKMPCGACRQVMAEFGDDNMIVEIGGVGTFTLGELIPQAFRLNLQPAAAALETKSQPILVADSNT